MDNLWSWVIVFIVTCIIAGVGGFISVIIVEQNRQIKRVREKSPYIFMRYSGAAIKKKKVKRG